MKPVVFAFVSVVMMSAAFIAEAQEALPDSASATAVERSLSAKERLQKRHEWREEHRDEIQDRREERQENRAERREKAGERHENRLEHRSERREKLKSRQK